MRHHRAASSFAQTADLYERARPGYPPAAVAYLVERLGLEPGRTVLDLGAGTGKLARLLAESGAHVVAVEPLAEMRALVPPGSRRSPARPRRFRLPDAAVDAVTVAQAFHWFDEETAGAEIRRVLRPGGLLALVSNRRNDSDPTTHAFGEILARHRAHPSLEPPPSGEQFAHKHSVASFADLAATESSIASLEDGERRAALADFAALGGGELHYTTYVSIEPH